MTLSYAFGSTKRVEKIVVERDHRDDGLSLRQVGQKHLRLRTVIYDMADNRKLSLSAPHVDTTCGAIGCSIFMT